MDQIKTDLLKSLAGESDDIATTRREGEQLKMKFNDGGAKFGGYTSVLESLREIIDLKMIKRSINNIKGILVHGPSGIGKTMAIETILEEVDKHQINLIRLTPGDLVKEDDPFRKIQRTFKFVTHSAPCILLIEEVDFLTKGKGTKDMFYGFLTELDNFTGENSLIIATTNKIGDVDKTMRRGGRFDIDIRMDMPTSEDRHAVFKSHLEAIGHDI
jgi:transitional endoplasmic reticulum ATPase